MSVSYLHLYALYFCFVFLLLLITDNAFFPDTPSSKTQAIQFDKIDENFNKSLGKING